MTRYSGRVVGLAAMAAEMGYYSIKSLARRLKVNKTTISRWLDERPEFKEAVDEGRRNHDEGVTELALHSQEKLIRGFSTTEKTFEPALVTRNQKTGVLEVDEGSDEKDVEKSMVLTKVVKKRVAPSQASVRLQLQARDKRYRPNATVELEAGKSITDIMALVSNSKNEN